MSSNENVTYQQLLETITPEIYQRMKSAVETGKWDNGIALSDEQKSHCMQAIIAWEHKNLSENERTGFIDRTKKTACETDTANNPDEPSPIKWQE